MSHYQDSAHALKVITPTASPSASGTKYRATYVSADGDYKIVFGDGTNDTIPLMKGMNPIEIRGVFSTPTPPGTVWGVT